MHAILLRELKKAFWKHRVIDTNITIYFDNKWVKITIAWDKKSWLIVLADLNISLVLYCKLIFQIIVRFAQHGWVPKWVQAQQHAIRWHQFCEVWTPFQPVSSCFILGWGCPSLWCCCRQLAVQVHTFSCCFRLLFLSRIKKWGVMNPQMRFGVNNWPIKLLTSH